jgi:PIN domain nuclease of toxin-antitoxin system
VILLDTCALLWLASDSGHLTPAARASIQDASVVSISAISGYEIGVKYQKGKLKLPALPDEWFRVIVKHHDIQVIPLDLSICIRATTLPHFHNDPCDRMIIATAEHFKIPVVTADSAFKSYGIQVIF